MGETDECQFAAIRLQGKHAFADETPSDCDTVETTNEFVVIPNFHACSQVLAVEFCIGLDHFLAQPGSFFLNTQTTAIIDYTFEIPVDGHLIAVLVDQRAHRVGDMDFFGEDYKALHRTIPMRLVIVAETVPGEDAVAIG